jgi:hypothetical protein
MDGYVSHRLIFLSSIHDSHKLVRFVFIRTKQYDTLAQRTKALESQLQYVDRNSKGFHATLQPLSISKPSFFSSITAEKDSLPRCKHCLAGSQPDDIIDIFKVWNCILSSSCVISYDLNHQAQIESLQGRLLEEQAKRSRSDERARNMKEYANKAKVRLVAIGCFIYI